MVGPLQVGQGYSKTLVGVFWVSILAKPKYPMAWQVWHLRRSPQSGMGCQSWVSQGVQVMFVELWVGVDLYIGL